MTQLMTEEALVEYVLNTLLAPDAKDRGVEATEVDMCENLTQPDSDVLSYVRWYFSDPTGTGTVVVSLASDELAARAEKSAIMRPSSVALTHMLGGSSYRVKKPLRWSTAIAMTHEPPPAAMVNIRNAFSHVLAT